MNITPPIAIRFHQINVAQVRDARMGYCPHCPRPTEGAHPQTLEQKHVAGQLQFWQCSVCEVVVALEKS